MKSRLTTCMVLFILLASASCSQAGEKEIAKDGIYITEPHRDGSKLKFVIRSQNQNFDCINLNGINGSGEILINNGSKRPSLIMSAETFRRSDITAYDNNPISRIAKIYGKSQEVIIDDGYKYIMMPVFNCKKFNDNTPQHVYVYTFPSI
jgi:hypothetical protein